MNDGTESLMKAAFANGRPGCRAFPNASGVAGQEAQRKTTSAHFAAWEFWEGPAQA